MRQPETPTTSGVLSACWAFYIIVLPFHRLWRLPWFDVKLQPPELVFLALAVVSAVLWWRRRTTWRIVLADAAVGAWVAANVIALLFADGPVRKEAVIETLGAVYLAGLYAAVRVTATSRLLDRFEEWFAYAAMAAAAFGIAGVVAALMSVPTRLATVVVLPYFGVAARAQAFTAGPGMLSSILLMAIPLFLGSRIDRGWRPRDVGGLLLLVVGLLATVSKTALCLVAAVSVVWALGSRVDEASRRIRLWTAGAVSFSIAVVMAVGSHVIVMRQNDVATMSTAQLVGGDPIASFRWNDESWVLMPTTYAFNNEASVLAVVRTWPVGVGPAGQPGFTAMLQQKEGFPQSVLMRAPHSTYLGTAAERGVAGFIALVALLIAGGLTISRLLSVPARSHWQAAAYAGAGMGFLIEALSTDLLNCRHYWLLLAIVVARLNAERGDERSVLC